MSKTWCQLTPDCKFFKIGSEAELRSHVTIATHGSWSGARTIGEQVLMISKFVAPTTVDREQVREQ